VRKTAPRERDFAPDTVRLEREVLLQEKETMKTLASLFLLVLLCASLSATNIQGVYLNFAGLPGEQVGVNILSAIADVPTTFDPQFTKPAPFFVGFNVPLGAGTGACKYLNGTPGCYGHATEVDVLYPAGALANFLMAAPAGNTLEEYWFNGTLVKSITHTSPPYYFNQQKQNGLVFDEVKLIWDQPTDFKFYSGTFDPVSAPEPSTLAMLGTGLLAGWKAFKSLKN